VSIKIIFWHRPQVFFAQVLQIGDPVYVPAETDILRARQKSTGITETWFNLGQLSQVSLFSFL
jgi:hypothetical protein